MFLVYMVQFDIMIHDFFWGDGDGIFSNTSRKITQYMNMNSSLDAIE